MQPGLHGGGRGVEGGGGGRHSPAGNTRFEVGMLNNSVFVKSSAIDFSTTSLQAT